ncbi:formylglycine-generating enzyme family protein [Lentiprolixibacter aurantiacus]|uniref:SUMF1/EgtB/PvdO family nonheme iron enzyme n=1 Tax=Lentiprolixibacter aurantiacus TaxID=2993939 RepID=A0AAE3SMJ9_9FLAO|nr:SUMF1/EgtB/PvdO family nonheme iron enzyme [Lentiprolixibacter aurantiacus]MCX2718782.1 SUMF1/EgtB/PvdO family nonheme iron enzyme [Lentiprolixibacter aurantiacus]
MIKYQVRYLLLFLLMAQFGFGQENYTQQLPGTTESLSMVYIPGGTFEMGSAPSEEGHLPDEAPQHQVSIAPFWMAEFEITWDLYNLFVERSIDSYQKEGSPGQEVKLDVDAVSGASTPYIDMSFGMGKDGYPAICMTQYAATKFCEWLSAMTGNFYRLPTEAEWEYACRAGTATAYSFGETADNLSEYAWFKDNARGSYHKVGEKKPNPWGLHDMHGNVAEWTLDAYDETTYSTRKKKTSDNPYLRPTKTYPRVVRGGSWMDSPGALRSAARRGSSKKWKQRDPQIPQSKWWHTDAPFVGFRVVRPVETPGPAEQKKYWNYSTEK